MAGRTRTVSRLSSPHIRLRVFSMQFRCSFQLPVLFQSPIEDESCSEVHPCFPEFPGSRQGLSFGGVEACDFGKIDDEGADVGPVTGRCPGAQDAEDVEGIR